jgi:hypothetical protein
MIPLCIEGWTYPWECPMSSNLQDTFQLVSASHIADFHFANEGFDVYFHLIYCPPYSGMILSLSLGKKNELKVKFIESILIWTFPPLMAHYILLLSSCYLSSFGDHLLWVLDERPNMSECLILNLVCQSNM